MFVIEENVATPFVAEALACLHAVHLGQLLGFPRVEVKGDSLSVIKKCQMERVDKSEIGGYIREIQSHKKRFNFIRFQFIPKIANQTAHLIVIEILKKSESFYLAGTVPSFASESLGLHIQRRREPD